jgi:hypothetical protein
MAFASEAERVAKREENALPVCSSPWRITAAEAVFATIFPINDWVARHSKMALTFAISLTIRQHGNYHSCRI